MGPPRVGRRFRDVGCESALPPRSRHRQLDGHVGKKCQQAISCVWFEIERGRQLRGPNPAGVAVEQRRHWHAGNRSHPRFARFGFCSFGTQISASRMHCRKAGVASAEQCASADYTCRKSVRYLRQNAGASLAGQTSFPPPSAMADGKNLRQWSSAQRAS